MVACGDQDARDFATISNASFFFVCLPDRGGARAIEAGQGTKMTQFFSVVLGGLFGGQGARGLATISNASFFFVFLPVCGGARTIEAGQGTKMTQVSLLCLVGCLGVRAFFALLRNEQKLQRGKSLSSRTMHVARQAPLSRAR